MVWQLISKKKILNTNLLIYECEGTESEIKEWFKTINIVGVPVNNQEILNSVYSGPFVTLAKQEFSNSQNANIQKWSAYIKGSANRQEFLECALKWVSKDNVGDYMSIHRFDKNIKELKNYFNTVLNWVAKTFLDIENEMRGIEWGKLYEEYNKINYDPAKISKEVNKLYSDPYVKNRRGVFEYILGGSLKTQLLDVRFFDEATKKNVYSSQTKVARKKDISNCPLCAIGHDANKKKIWMLEQIDADHVTAWTKGGQTTATNCQVLCKTHNRAKGNR